MKKFRLYLLLFVVIGIALNACYKDLGNYNYKEINELTIAGLEDRYERDQDDSLNIRVGLQGTQYSDTSKFTYEWEVAQNIISTEKDLRIKVNMSVGNHLGRFIVTDKSNGAKAYFRFNLRVSSATAGDLLMVLGSFNGEAELSYKRLDKEGDFAVNFYKERFGESLGRDPRNINVNYNYYAGIEPFTDVATLGGLFILTGEGLKVIDKNSLGPKEGVDKITGATFASFLPPYPVQDVSDFKPEYMHSQLNFWNPGSGGAINQQGQLYVIASGGLYTLTMNPAARAFYVNRKIAGGYLAPAMCYAYVYNTQPDTRTRNPRGFDVSTLTMMYDNTAGKFLNTSLTGSPAPFYNSTKNEYIPLFPGYKMIYATHTSTPNKCLAVLSNGTQVKLMYINMPGTAAEQQTTKPFVIEGTLDITDGLINESTTRFYNMKFTPYLLFSSKNKIYRYNLLNIVSNIPPVEVIADLTELGYGADARITSFTVSRSEKTLVALVSRYGQSESDAGPLKGDVVKFSLNSTSISATFMEKFEGVCGKPVDIKIKYQTHQRDGYNATGVFVDKL